MGRPAPLTSATVTIVDSVRDPSGTGIAQAIGTLIADGHLSAGTRLPTVRALASQLDISPSTVGEAWRILRNRGLIDTDRRRGTRVRESLPATTGRYWHVPVEPGTLDLDLSTGTPDPALLPPLAPALHRVQLDLAVTSYLDEPLIPELGAALERTWPFPPESLTIVDGAQDALDRLVGGLVGFGDRVIVEDPTFPPLLDLLDLAGATVIGVPVDAEGIQVSGVADALLRDPVAMFIQPRAHNPTGVSISERRCRQLADQLHHSAIIVVEDDHSGAVAGAPLHSLGVHIPNQTVHIRSFSKSHGPDLRLAAIGGAAQPIESLVRRRRLGPSWTSRLLQQVLYDMLCDAEVDRMVAAAEQAYTERRRSLVERLRSLGVLIEPGGSGLNLWVPVDNDHDAVVGLAARGIGAAPGEPFEIASTNQRHIRLTISAVTPTQVDDLADAVAEAATTRHGSTAR